MEMKNMMMSSKASNQKKLINNIYSGNKKKEQINYQKHKYKIVYSNNQWK